MKQFMKKWGTMFVLSLALAIIIIDNTVLNVSITSLITDLHTDIKTIQTIMTTYTLILAAFMITGGRLGDIFGRKKMFMVGAIIFGVGSFIASISTNSTTLLVGWSIIEGIGAALMMPATASLILTTYSGKDRAIAFGIWGGLAGAASAIGPLVGGFITTNYSWHWAFRINILIVLLLLTFSRYVKEYISANVSRHLDFGGILISAIGLSLIVYPIIESSKYGWWYAKENLVLWGHTINPNNFSIVPLMILAGLIILIGFYFWEKKVVNNNLTPLVRLNVFKNYQFTSGLATLVMLVLGQTGMIFVLPIFLQTVNGLSAYETGKAFLPMSLAMFFAAPFSAQLGKKILPKYLIHIGIMISMIGIFLLKNSLSPDAVAKDLAPSLFVFGLGMGIVMAQITNLTLSASSSDEAGETSGILSTIRNLGAALGSAIIGAAFIGSLTTNMTGKIQENTTLPSAVKAAITNEVNSNASEFEFSSASQVSKSNQIPPRYSEEIKKITNSSIVDSNKIAVNYMIAFIALSLLISFGLPKVHESKKQ